MKTYKDVDEFIMDVFPQEYLKIIKQRKSNIEEFIEKADIEFNQKLEAILTGKKEEQKEAP
jgi:hypothetical protein